jgi:hypothetical protein
VRSAGNFSVSTTNIAGCSVKSRIVLVVTYRCPPPTIGIDNLSNTTFNLSTTTIANISIDFYTLGTFTKVNNFIAQLSNATGSFANPREIGRISGVSSGQITAIIPNTTPVGSGYKIRVVSTTPKVIGKTYASAITIRKASQKTSTRDKIQSQNEDPILYPNPAIDKVNVNVPESSFGTKGYADIMIFDINERMVKKIQSQLVTTTIDVSNFNDGVYIVKIGEKENQISKRLVVRHN